MVIKTVTKRPEMEKNSLFYFEWNRCPSGYAIENHSAAPLRKGRVHTALTAASAGPVKKIHPLAQELKSYNLFEKSGYGIGRTFSELLNKDKLSLNEREVKKFAKKYGLLGITPKNIPEDIDTWLIWVKHFHEIYELSESYGRLDYAKALTAFNVPPLPVFIRPQITSDPKENSSTLYSKNGSQLFFRPQNLITAMYIILAEHLTTGIELQKCINSRCIEWFPKRANKKYCSDACKTSFHRDHKNN